MEKGNICNNLYNKDFLNKIDKNINQSVKFKKRSKAYTILRKNNK